jgi:MFS family permease
MAVSANTSIQLSVPDHLRGRVISVYTTVFAGSVPVGGLLMGAIASTWGVPMALFVGAVLSLAVGIGAWVWLDRIKVEQRLAGERNRAASQALVAAADIGAIDPEGVSAGAVSSAGSVSGARPR